MLLCDVSLLIQVALGDAGVDIQSGLKGKPMKYGQLSIKDLGPFNRVAKTWCGGWGKIRGKENIRYNVYHEISHCVGCDVKNKMLEERSQK